MRAPALTTHYLNKVQIDAFSPNLNKVINKTRRTSKILKYVLGIDHLLSPKQMKQKGMVDVEYMMVFISLSNTER
jgi:hypothetical protein